MKTTSRVGKKPVVIPPGVDVKIAQQEISIKGPKGHAVFPIHPFVQINMEGNHLTIHSNEKGGYCRSGSGARLYNSIVGTTRAKINNLVLGVSKGFERKLILVGVGYRAQSQGRKLNLTLGFSHPVTYTAPEGITIETPSQTEIIIKGSDKQLVGHVAASIRAFRGPEPYKGKGIRYSDERIELKETKKK